MWTTLTAQNVCLKWKRNLHRGCSTNVYGKTLCIISCFIQIFIKCRFNWTLYVRRKDGRRSSIYGI